MSAPKFSALLTEQGVAVPTKISPTTGKEAPALAKTDQEFLDLQEHDNPIVAAAAMARLGTRSTILETRIEAFIETATACDGKLPVPLQYWGATTTGRWSGWAYNPQNLPRINPSKPALTDVLRLSLQAPPGHQIVVVDLSGIELRMNHFLWKVPSSMALFQASPDKADLYKDFASTLYDVPLEEVTKTQRQIGKVAHLGLGYGAGPSTFQRIAKMMGGVELSEVEAMDVTNKWREEHQPIVQGWATCQGAVWAMASGREMPLDPWGLCRTGKDCIHLPKGVLRYPELRQEWSDKTQRQEWVYGKGRHKSRIYGPKVDENLIQALSRTVMADVMLAFAQTPLGQRYPLAHCVHDEVVYVVRDEDAEAVLAAVSQLMRTPPSWFPALITWSEGSYASRYGWLSSNTDC
jgi:DNA polymerase